MRDIVRAIQELRKEKGLNPSDLVELFVEIDEKGKKVIQKFYVEISKLTGLKKINFEDTKGGKTLDLEGLKLTLDIK